MAIAIAATDMLTDVTAHEAGGHIMACTRRMLLKESGSDVWTQHAASSFGDSMVESLWTYQRLSQASLPTLPKAGDVLDATYFPNLFAETFDIRMRDQHTCELYVIYNRYNTTLNGGDGKPLLWMPLQSTKQVTTQKDAAGSEIIVTHRGRPQMGEVSVLESEPGIAIELVVTTFTPTAIVTTWTNAVNSADWHDPGDAGHYLCRSVSHRPLNTSAAKPSRKYIFGFEFIYNTVPWQPDVFWRDPIEGRPPEGLVDGVGWKTIPWHRAIDFNLEPGQ